MQKHITKYFLHSMTYYTSKSKQVISNIVYIMTLYLGEDLYIVEYGLETTYIITCNT